MKFFVLAAGVILAALAVMVSGWQKDVVKFSMLHPETREFFKHLNRGNKVQNPSRLGAYSYKNCGDPKTELLNIGNLIFGPDPITFPGPLEVTLQGVVKQTVDTPLKGVLQLSKRVGSTWIKIPCIDKIGSCTYDDICALLAGAVCPPPFVSAGVPCKCPFTAGNYTLPKSSFDVDVALFPSGDYHAIANLSTSETPVACLDLNFTFS